MAVYNGDKFFRDNEVKQLRQTLEAYAYITFTQILVAIVNTLNREYIGTYTAECTQKRRIGQKEKNNSLLILISKADSKIWIITGCGLKEDLTDAMAKTIIENVILLPPPGFRKASYYEGLDKGTSAILKFLPEILRALWFKNYLMTIQSVLSYCLFLFLKEGEIKMVDVKKEIETLHQIYWTLLSSAAWEAAVSEEDLVMVVLVESGGSKDL
jgi:hypothetical protein